MTPAEPTSNNVPPFSAANPPGAAAVPWGRQSAATQERVTARVRRVVQGLPSWDPTPPGEIMVRRPGAI
ncbi:MAG: hypothetical protein ACRDT0_16460 [Pseudonocardiaceae bacterium]